MISNAEKLARTLWKGESAESSKAVSEYSVEGLFNPVIALAFPTEDISPEEAQ